MSVYPGGVHPFADMFPLLVGQPYAALCMDIEEHGLRDPLVVTSDGTLVDGRNRWSACEDAGVEPRFERLPEGTSEVEILDLIMSKNIHRRQLDTTDRALLGVEYKKRYERLTSQGYRSDLKEPPNLSPHGEKLPRPTSVEKAAAVVGVSKTSIERAQRVIRDTPDLAQKVRDKQLTVGEADDERKKRMVVPSKPPVKEETRGGSKRSPQKQVLAFLSQLNGIVHATELIDPSVFNEEHVKEFGNYVSALNSYRRKLTKE